MGHRNDKQYRSYDKKHYEYRTRKPSTKSSRPSHVTVEPKGNEPIERTIKRFLRKYKKSGINEKLRTLRYYEKPSAKRRKKKLKREATIKKARQKGAFKKT